MLQSDFTTVSTYLDRPICPENPLYEGGNKREPNPGWWPDQDQVEQDAHDRAVAGDPDHPFASDPEPPETQSLVDRYTALLSSPDPAIRAMDAEQLGRLNGTCNQIADTDNAGEVDYRPGPDAGADLPTLAGASVPLHQRGADRYDCGCPTAQASKSGMPCTFWRDGDGEGRWYCRSCRRGGAAIGWLLATGLTYDAACRQLGIVPIKHARGTRRPPRHAVPVPPDWRPSAAPLPAGWRPGQPLPGEVGR